MACSYSFTPEVKTECILSLVSDLRSGAYKTALGPTLQKTAAIMGSAAAMLPSSNSPDQPAIHLAGGFSAEAHDEATLEDMADELESCLADCQVAGLPQPGISASFEVPVQEMNPIVVSILATLLQTILGKLLGR